MFDRLPRADDFDPARGFAWATLLGLAAWAAIVWGWA